MHNKKRKVSHFTGCPSKKREVIKGLGQYLLDEENSPNDKSQQTVEPKSDIEAHNLMLDNLHKSNASAVHLVHLTIRISK